MIENVSNILTIKTIKKVMNFFSACDKPGNFETAVDAINGYFASKLSGVCENRLFFVRLPDNLSDIDDETYQKITGAFIAAFQQGYIAGVRDLDSLMNETENEGVIYNDATSKEG